MLLTLTLIFLFFAFLHPAQAINLTGGYPKIEWPSGGMSVPGTSFFANMKMYDLVSISAESLNIPSYLQLIREAIAANPHLIVSLYVASQEAPSWSASNHPLYGRIYQDANNQGYMATSCGTCSCWGGNPCAKLDTAWTSFLPATMDNWITAYDPQHQYIKGVFYDNVKRYPFCCPNSTSLWQIGMTQILRNTNYITVGNGSDYESVYPDLDIVKHESWPGTATACTSGGNWRTDWNFGMRTFFNRSKNGQAYILAHNPYVTEDYARNRALANTRAQEFNTMRLGLAGSLLTDRGFYNYWPSYYATTINWYDEFSVDLSTGRSSQTPSAKHYLGLPRGPAKNLQGETLEFVFNKNPCPGPSDPGNLNLSTWIREFDNGIVIANPTNSIQTIPKNTLIATGNLKRIRGTVDSATNNGDIIGDIVTIPARDGLILLKTSDRSPTTTNTPPPSLPNPIIFAQSTDEHMGKFSPDITAERFKNVLVNVKKYNPKLLISTGDHTEIASTNQFNTFSTIFSQIGGFIKYPANPQSTTSIAFMPVAGNHDSWTNSPYDEDFLNYTIDNYRFIALSHELNNAPAAVWSNLESQLRSSCQDNRPIIFYYHYAPNGFIEADLQMSPTAWNSLNQLLQRYPVIAYLGGHIHTRINRTYTPGFFAQTISSSGTSQDYQIYTLANGSINIQNSSDPNNPLLIIEPKQYFSGLDYTKTPKSNRNIKVYAKTYNGSVTQVKYKINSSPSANLTRLGTSDYYQAEIDTNSLTGPHTLQVDMITTSSNIGQSLTINFADSVRTRTASGCSLSPTPTKQPPTPIATSTRSPGSPPTEPPQPTSIPVDPASCTGCYGYAQTCLRGCPLTNVCVIPPGSATACGWEAYRCCQPVLLPSPSPVPQFQCHCPRTPDLKPQGDANCDGTINQNQTDFGIWSNEFLNFSSGRHQALWRADFNCDRKVDIHDFNIWKSN